MTTFNNLPGPVRKTDFPLLLILCLMLPALAGAQLVNGSFELGLAGWTVNKPSIVISPFAPASDGTNCVEIGWDNLAGAILSQVVPIVGGYAYRLTFDFLALGASTGVIQVDVDSSAGILASQTFSDAATAGPFVYKAKSVSFIVPLSVTNITLKFIDQSPGNGGGVDPIIDNVKCVTDTPFFLLQPTNQTVTVGGTAIFSADASSAASLNFLWRKEGVPITGATNNSLTLTNVSVSDAGNYDVVATNHLGSVTSSNAVLQVLPANSPSITVNSIFAVGTVTVVTPANITITGGFPGGFTFYTLDGSTPTTSSLLYAGPFAITNSLTLRAMSLRADFAQSSEAPAVNLVVIPVYALATSTSGSGIIAVSPPTGPYISNRVVSVTAIPIVNWAFDHWSGDLSGNVNPTTLTMNGPRSVQAVFIPTALPLTISTPGGGSATANGQVIAPNAYYPADSVVSLEATPGVGWSFIRWQGTVNSTVNPLAITMNQTQDVQVIFGTVFTANVGGSGAIQPSETNPVQYGTPLTLTALASPGYYFVTWTGAVSGTNNPTSLTVTSPTPTVGALFAASPKPTIITEPTNVSVLLGNAAQFAVHASGALPLSYQWRKAGALLVNETNTSYLIPTTVATNAGNYDVVVVNGYGSSVTSSVASLTVLIPVGITNHPHQQVVPLGGTVAFSVGAYGNPAPYYQWTLNGAFLTNESAPSLVITNVGTNQLGDYAAIVWNSFSVATSSVAPLLMSPSIRAPFVGDTAIWGKSATLAVSAVGSGNLGYQWFKDGVLVAQGTNAALAFPAVQIGDGGLYSVVVTSPWGSVTNTPALLVVNPANIALGFYAGVTIDGVVGYTYGIQSSTDLTDTNSWMTLTNLTLTEPMQIWVDTSVDVHAPGVLKRFYRIVAP